MGNSTRAVFGMLDDQLAESPLAEILSMLSHMLHQHNYTGANATKSSLQFSVNLSNTEVWQIKSML